MSAAALPLPQQRRDSEIAAALNAIHERLAKLANCAPPTPVDNPPAPQLFELARKLGLSVGERQAVLFAAAAELCETTASLVQRIGAGAPSIGLMLRACDGLELPMLRPDGALRRARLLALGGAQDARFTERAVCIEEPVLHFLHGVLQLGPELTMLSLPWSGNQVPIDESTIEAIARHAGAEASPFSMPSVEVACEDVDEGVAHAIAGLRRAGYGVLIISAARLPIAAADLDAVRSCWLRDSLLHGLGLVVVADARDGQLAPSQLLGWSGPVVFVGLERRLNLLVSRRIVVRHDRAQRLDAWRTALGEHDHERHQDVVARLAARFRLSSPAIAALASQHGAGTTEALWCAAREAARREGFDLVERIRPVVELDRVILPSAAATTLRTMVAAARVHHQIVADWTNILAGGRGLGIAALFSGPSGTGKTMAAEAVAHALGLDLYRVDVSTVVSKYIGETEKNLRRIFAEAESAGAVLLFDEADTLFGKRSEVRDAHDRYANMEVGYLLQLMESFSGIAVLTTNFREALDEAFTRRLRFIVDFPVPGRDERLLIWQGAFPAALDVSALDFARLSRLSVTGGVIRNIALGSAFRAASADSARAVSMAQVLDAARAEYLKLGRSLVEIDSKEWS